jgi:hypothetical protein
VHEHDNDDSSEHDCDGSDGHITQNFMELFLLHPCVHEHGNDDSNVHASDGSDGHSFPYAGNS